ncbi:MAG: anhydro-N-acetylmuramic acid kinase, partial [Pseudomonadota bacterium]
MTADGLYIGLISGTSMDGIDAALVELGDHTCKTLATRGHDYPKSLQDRLLAASRQPESIGVDELGRLDHAVGECFRDAALSVIELAGAHRAAIAAIGSHGQTVRHLPRDEEAFSLQIGDPNVIAAGTGITTVADFRRRDIALGGEGAPIAPGFHQWLFGEASTTRVVL